jgi:ATP-binding cassette subfamily B protein
MRLIVRPYTTSFTLALAGVVAMDAVMSLLNPLLLKYIFDEGVIKKDFRLFIVVTVGFMILATLFRLFSLWNNLYVQDLKNRILKRLIGSMLESYYKMPYIQVMKNKTGYYTSRIYDEPLSASSTAIDLAFAVCPAAVSFLVAFGVVVFLSIKATFALVLTVPFLIMLANKYHSEIKQHSRDEKEGEGELRGVITGSAESYRTVNLFGLHSAVLSKINEKFEKYTTSLNARVRNSAKHNTYGAIFMSYGEMLVIIVCGYAILKGEMSFGGFMAFMNAFWLAVGNMRTLVQKIPEFSRNSMALHRLAEFGMPASEAAGTGGGTGIGAITLENVGFSYGDKQVFSNLSFSAGKGEKLLLSGKNGSGKSTVANMLSGFLAPDNGTARILGVEKTSACVSPHHFAPGTLRDNLKFDSHTDEQRRYLNGVLADFKLTESLDKSPDALSAGQKKKAEIAMGLMKDAELFLFDEPLANVDVESKPIIMEHIFNRTKDKILVVVMHGDDEFRGQFTRMVSL